MLSSNTSAVSGDTVYVEDVFSTYLYTGTGSSQTINNGIDLAGKGGMVWGKRRSGAGTDSPIFDTVRSRANGIATNSTAAQVVTPAGYDLASFNSDGVTLGNPYDWSLNNSGFTQVLWTFRKQPKFFDVVTWTGDGAAGRSIAHSLGSVPGCIMIKNTSAVSDWTVYHRSTGNTNYLALNATDGSTAGSFWGSTTPTATDFTVSTSGGHQVNWNGENYVAYIFAHDAGGFGLTGTDNVISCGSYTGTGAAGNAITLGYEPQFIMVKATSTTSNWVMIDTMRGAPVTTNAETQQLFANLTNAEGSAGLFFPTATGFQSIGASSNTSGASYIYIAIRRGPMKVPTDGTKVFTPSVRSGTGSAATMTGVGFPPDLLISSERTSGVLFTKGWHDRLRGNVILRSENTNNEAADSTGVTAYGQDGFSFGTDGGFANVNYSGSNYVYEAFKRAPSFFDEVCYTGTGANQNLSHNLGVVPELMIVKSRSLAGQEWPVQALGDGTKILKLNSTSAFITNSAYWNNTGATSSVFTVTGSGLTGSSGATYVAYLFATCAGVSKVGSYTGTGTTKQVDCGFAAGARFVLIKRTDSTGDWYVWDSARGIVAGNDPYLLLNSTAAEVTTTDYIDPYSAGFELSSTAPAALNASGGTYIFLAIA